MSAMADQEVTFDRSNIDKAAAQLRHAAETMNPGPPIRDLISAGGVEADSGMSVPRRPDPWAC